MVKLQDLEIKELGLVEKLALTAGQIAGFKTKEIRTKNSKIIIYYEKGTQTVHAIRVDDTLIVL